MQRTLALFRIVAVLPVLFLGVEQAAAIQVSPAVVSGVVTDAATGEPMAGVLVTLRDAGQESVRSQLTGSDGRYSLSVPGAGTWSLRAERLGYAPVQSEPIELSEGDRERVDLVIRSAPIALDAVEVSSAADGTCRRLDPDEGSLLVRLWEQARSALAVVTWAESEERYSFDLVRWKRTTELFSDRVVDEELGERTRSIHPFESAPAEELLSDGWIRAADEADTYDYYGLDARTLLSPAFEAAHCFAIREHPDDPGRVGLAFEPIQRASKPGVEGVLWLDRRTAALDRLSFHYTFHPHEPPIPTDITPLFDGEVEYRELPDGGWVVDRWSLRVPQYQIQMTSGASSLGSMRAEFGGEFADRLNAQPRWWRDLARESRLAVVEEGGELVSIETSDGAYIPTRQQAALRGTVIDSTRMTGLADAEVRLVGTTHSTRTDSEGRFLLEIPLDGTYEVGVSHPRLGVLGVESLPTHEIRMTRGETARIELALPSEKTLAALACGREPGVGSEAIVWGRVMEPGIGEPLPGVTVTLMPSDVPPGGPVPDGYQTRTDADGQYRICDVEPGIRFEATSELMGVAGAPRRIELAVGAVVMMDLTIRIGALGEIRGRVLHGEGDEPVGSATVTALGSETTRQATTTPEGRFHFGELPAGPYQLRVEHLAYRDLDTEVDVEGGGRTTNLTVRLLRDAIALDPVQVVVDARPSWGPLVDAYDRRDQLERVGIGAFIGRDEIDLESTSSVGRVIARLPGARIPSGSGGPVRSPVLIHPSRDCAPSFYLDGMRHVLDEGELIDDVIPLQIVEMIEVYRSAATLPGEFADVNATACGAIAVWTRRGG